MDIYSAVGQIFTDASIFKVLTKSFSSYWHSSSSMADCGSGDDDWLPDITEDTVLLIITIGKLPQNDTACNETPFYNNCLLVLKLWQDRS